METSLSSSPLKRLLLVDASTNMKKLGEDTYRCDCESTKKGNGSANAYSVDIRYLICMDSKIPFIINTPHLIE